MINVLLHIHEIDLEDMAPAHLISSLYGLLNSAVRLEHLVLHLVQLLVIAAQRSISFLSTFHHPNRLKILMLVRFILHLLAALILKVKLYPRSLLSCTSQHLSIEVCIFLVLL